MCSQLIMSQTWALIRRYCIILIRSPIWSLIRILVVPGLVLGLCGYLLISMAESEYKGSISFPILVQPILLFVTFGHAYSFNTTLIQDKASNMKSLMISMGLSRTSYYLAYSICMLICILPLSLTVAIFAIKYVYLETQASNFNIILLFILFSLQITALVFAVSSFISSTSFTAVMGLILLIEGSVFHLVMVLSQRFPNWQAFIVFASSLTPYQSIRVFSSSYTLCKNCDKIQIQTGKETQISQPTHYILLAQLFWTVAFLAFSRWFDEVCPWQKDSAVQGPCFCLNCFPSYQNSDETQQDSRQTSRFFEQRTQNPEEGISLYHLKKSFNGVAVVNDLSFKIYRGETTLLLGHNGAGKTTLMSMILGKLRPDTGFVRTRKHEDGLCIGYCPQTSVLDENLTVMQHVELFHDMKTPFGADRRANINTTLDDVSLVVHANKLPSELSGGMKRKLSLAMAFVGNSSILILDEPSSGLDPDSRVYVWNAIRRYRTNRTVLLSTQHMEEADYLGDRIAIMSGGRIVCCGSSLFLNQVFGAGYKLRIECLARDKSAALSLIKYHYKKARMYSEESSGEREPQSTTGNSSIDFVVELVDERSSDTESKLISLLKDLERLTANPVRSFGLKSSSIEDVMLNTSEYFKQQVDDKQSSQLTLETVQDSIQKLTNPRRLQQSVSKQERHKMQLVSLIVKNLRSYRTNWLSTIIYRLILPILSTYWTVNSLNSNLKSLSDPAPSLDNVFCFMYFIYIPVMERASKFKIMQLTSNTNYVVYWISHLVTDIMVILIAAVSYNIFIAVYFTGEFAISAVNFHLLVTTGLVLFGLTTAIFCYFLSMLFDSAQSGLSAILFLNAASYITWQFIILLKLTVGTKVNVNWLSPTMTYLFTSLSPIDAYSAIQGALVSECYVKTSLGCKQTISTSSQTFAQTVWYGFAAMIFQIFLYGFSLYIVESKILDMGYYWRQIPYLWRSKPKVIPVKITDEDVMQESRKASALIQQGVAPNISLVASDVSKSYISGVRVVEGLSLTVNRGECFGLLGVNGAGKSTTFSVLSSEFRPDSGSVIAQGVQLDQDVTLYRQKISYDPQVNPSLSLSVYESLHLMAVLRDVEQSTIPSLITSLLKLLDMESHIWKKAADLSGGTLRKLALGMALLGNPNLLLLDEPTAGIDPVARHGIWTLLRSVRKQNNSIVISSHAMEECEAICDRISIMAQGRLRCVGTFLHLRQKFAQGCTIRVQFKENINLAQSGRGTGSPSTLIAALKQQLGQKFGPSIRLVDSNINSATFNVNDKNIKRSKLFQEMRAFRQKNPSSSYIINDSSLEDIFIKLAREQQELEDRARAR